MAFIVSLWERLGYKPDKQEDAADVLENVLDTCFADSARDQVNSTFAFSVLSVATCPALHHTCESVPHDVWGSPRILRLPLAPFKQGDSLFTSENTADVCKTCRRRRPADTLKMSFKLMRGDVLCAAVSRSRSVGKDATPFYPPLHISTPFGREYVLRYQCAHQGVSSTSGHWVGFVYSRNRNRGPIVKIDDGVVAPVAPNDADLSQGVLFFYERIPSLAYTPLKISQYFATQTPRQSGIGAAFLSILPEADLQQRKRSASDAFSSEDESVESAPPPPRRRRSKEPPSRGGRTKRKSSEALADSSIPPAQRQRTSVAKESAVAKQAAESQRQKEQTKKQKQTQKPKPTQTQKPKQTQKPTQKQTTTKQTQKATHIHPQKEKDTTEQREKTAK